MDCTLAPIEGAAYAERTRRGRSKALDAVAPKSGQDRQSVRALRGICASFFGENMELVRL